jgi:hypothetical protein
MPGIIVDTNCRHEKTSGQTRCMPPSTAAVTTPCRCPQPWGHAVAVQPLPACPAHPTPPVPEHAREGQGCRRQGRRRARGPRRAAAGAPAARSAAAACRQARARKRGGGCGEGRGAAAAQPPRLPREGGYRDRIAEARGWRDATGMAAAARQTQQRLRRSDHVDRARGIHHIPSGRTVSLSAFALHCRRKLEGFEAGRRLYGSMQARRARLRVHGLRMQHMHRLAQTLAWGATSVSGRWRRDSRVVDHSGGRWQRASRGDHSQTRVSIIAWGAASVGAGGPISRQGLGPSREFERLGVLFLRIDEYSTSKVCTSCWEENTHQVVLRRAPAVPQAAGLQRPRAPPCCGPGRVG